MSEQELKNRHCVPCEGGIPPLDEGRVQKLLAMTPGWELGANGAEIERTFRFKNFHETMAFVNAVAWIAHREDHHPDMEVGYNRCRIRYSTHAIGGLSDNDFICAARINGLQEA